MSTLQSRRTLLAHWVLAPLACVVGSCSAGPTQHPRPDFYVETWPQFTVRYTKDPRVITLMRSGAGPHRRAEYTVLELVDQGRRLSVLHRATLCNDFVPLQWTDLGHGRFLVTQDERTGVGTTDNCLVVYDLARDARRAMRLEDFLPVTVRDALHHNDWPPGMTWSGVRNYIDAERLVFYTASPEECRERGLPFVVVDLRSRSARLTSVPERLPDGAADTLVPNGIAWRWSMGGSGEPEWDVKQAMPRLLEGRVLPHASEDELALLDVDTGELRFEWNASAGSYVRCRADERVDGDAGTPGSSNDK